MIKILLFLVFVVAVIAAVTWVGGMLMNHFSTEKRAARQVAKADRSALTAARTRSNLAERALREIAAGAEYPIFVAEDALRNINNTYDTKEIQ